MSQVCAEIRERRIGNSTQPVVAITSVRRLKRRDQGIQGTAAVVVLD
jgi:hypothetical protein